MGGWSDLGSGEAALSLNREGLAFPSPRSFQASGLCPSLAPRPRPLPNLISPTSCPLVIVPAASRPLAERGLGKKQFSEWPMVRAGTQADDFQLLCLLRWASSDRPLLSQLEKTKGSHLSPSHS